MLVAVLGGSGRTGQLVVRHAIQAGHHVRVLVRDLTRAPTMLAPSDIVTGDPTSRNAIAAVLDGADAAISALGPRAGGSTNGLCSTATGHVADVAAGDPASGTSWSPLRECAAPPTTPRFQPAFRR